MATTTNDTGLAEWLKSLPDALKDSAIGAVKSVVDRRAEFFGQSMNRNMPLGHRQPTHGYHTNTQLNTKKRIDKPDVYGWKFLYNGSGYKKVSWKTYKDRGVPYDLIANVTSTGRKAGNNEFKKWGAETGNKFIPMTVHQTLTGIDQEIYLEFERKTKGL